MLSILSLHISRLEAMTEMERESILAERAEKVSI